MPDPTDVQTLSSLSPRGIIDVFVNANPPGPGAGGTNLLGRPLQFTNLDEMLAQMDSLGVTRAVMGQPISTTAMSEADGYRWTLDAVQRHPDRFALAVRVDPAGMMDSVRALESMVRNDGAVALRLGPARVGKPLTNKIYFPLYTKCVELGIPIMAPVGLPAPRVPGMVQHPKYLDELCFLWPELTVITTHGGEPWTALLVKLMAKWPNLYHTISAFAPKYYPKDLVAFLSSSRGRQKVMLGTDAPYMPTERVFAELPSCGISPESFPAFLHDNAARIFPITASAIPA